jgi:hypothetical protein
LGSGSALVSGASAVPINRPSAHPSTTRYGLEISCLVHAHHLHDELAVPCCLTKSKWNRRHLAAKEEAQLLDFHVSVRRRLPETVLEALVQTVLVPFKVRANVGESIAAALEWISPLVTGTAPTKANLAPVLGPGSVSALDSGFVPTNSPSPGASPPPLGNTRISSTNVILAPALASGSEPAPESNAVQPTVLVPIVPLCKSLFPIASPNCGLLNLPAPIADLPTRLQIHPWLRSWLS